MRWGSIGLPIGRNPCKHPAMDERRIAANLAAVEAHFHSEAEQEVAAALALYTDDVFDMGRPRRST